MLLQIIEVDEKTLEELRSEENANDKSMFDEASSSIKMKILICSTLMRMFRTLREDKELLLRLKGFCPGNKIPKGLLLLGSNAIKSAFDRYCQVKSMDLINEQRPNK